MEKESIMTKKATLPDGKLDSSMLLKLLAGYAMNKVAEDEKIARSLCGDLFVAALRIVKRERRIQRALRGSELTLNHVVSALLMLATEFLTQNEQGARITSGGIVTPVLPDR